MPTEAKTRDLPTIVLAALFVLIGGYVLWATQTMSAMGAVFPRTIAGVLVLASLALLVVQLLRPGRAAPEDASVGGSTSRRLAVVAVMLAWALLFPTLGFVTSGIVAFVVIALAANYDRLGPQRAALYLGTAVVVVVLFWLLMRNVLNIPVPAGVLV